MAYLQAGCWNGAASVADTQRRKDGGLWACHLSLPEVEGDTVLRPWGPWASGSGPAATVAEQLPLLGLDWMERIDTVAFRRRAGNCWDWFPGRGNRER